jgi:NADP-dependent 3-hydroxy acid dehydrogenase YdfG
LVFDVRNNDEVTRQLGEIPQEWQAIEVLINNAGLAVGLTAIQDGVLDDWERMIDTNVKGLLYVSKAVLPYLIARASGTIINIGSIAAKEAYGKGNVYCGTKHAVDAITKGMRIDLLEHNIRVGAIHPGMVDTEFSLVRFKGDKVAADKVYENLTPLYAQDIADALWFMLSRPAHVCINDMVIMPTVQANTSNTIRRVIQ